MKSMLLITVTLVTIPVARAQQGGLQGARHKIGDTPPAAGIADLFVTPSPNNVPISLKHLTSMAAVVARGTVSRTLPSRETEPRALETDSVVRISDVIKGFVQDNEIVISQRGGTRNGLTVIPAQYSLFVPGEEYILFLVENPYGRVSGLTQLKHYLAVGVWTGLFPFKNGRMRINSPLKDGIRKAYEDLPVEQIIAEVLKLLQ
jgi:hypothetical protein